MFCVVHWSCSYLGNNHFLCGRSKTMFSSRLCWGCGRTVGGSKLFCQLPHLPHKNPSLQKSSEEYLVQRGRLWNFISFFKGNRSLSDSVQSHVNSSLQTTSCVQILCNVNPHFSSLQNTHKPENRTVTHVKHLTPNHVNLNLMLFFISLQIGSELCYPGDRVIFLWCHCTVLYTVCKSQSSTCRYFFLSVL